MKNKIASKNLNLSDSKSSPSTTRLTPEVNDINDIRDIMESFKDGKF